MNMELIQSAASDALVNVVLAVIALAGAYADGADQGRGGPEGARGRP